MKTRKQRHAAPHILSIHGYRVVFMPMDLDTLHVECAVNNGFITENKNTTGINHLLEHVLSEAWKQCKNNCYRFLNDHGVVMNASTNMTLVRYFTTGLPTDADLMINYIIDIMETPIFSTQKIKREKKAVVNELLTVSNNPDTGLTDLFNKNFYAVEGMQYAEDTNRQIKALSSIHLRDLKNVFLEHYNRNNMIFVVCGKFNKRHVIDVLSRKFVKYAIREKVEPYCFSKKHDILFLKNKSIDIPKLMIGFPSVVAPSSELFVLIPSVVKTMNSILFEILRGKHDLVYGIESVCENTICGTVVIINAFVLQRNIKTVLGILLSVLKKFKKEFIPERFLSSNKKLQQIDFNNKINNTPALVSDMMIEQLMHQIHLEHPVIHTPSEIQRKIQSFDLNTYKRVMNLIFDFNVCLIVYQGNANANLSLSDLF